MYSANQQDRARGVLLGLAVGDALGAGYEYGPPVRSEEDVRMIGGGLGDFEPGEWTDDTSMAIVIAQALARGLDIRDLSVQDRLVNDWRRWALQASDVGAQTLGVLTASGETPHASSARAAARDWLGRTGQGAGNGALMRTSPIALAFVGQERRAAQAARAVCTLTHADADAEDACAIWTAGVAAAIQTGTLRGIATAVADLPAERQKSWRQRLQDAQKTHPDQFTQNGWVVHAFQAAWSLIWMHRDLPAAAGFRSVVEGAVRAGGDTDTVAAIAGTLAGARWGAHAIDPGWIAKIHGWPGLNASGLVALTDQIANRF